jgi:hypothetical protein
MPGSHECGVLAYMEKRNSFEKLEEENCHSLISSSVQGLVM